MKKIILAAGLSLMTTAAFAASNTLVTEPATGGTNNSAMTSPNGVDENTTGGQGTGSGTDANGTVMMKKGAMSSDDNMTTGSMKKEAPTTGANASATTSVDGVDSSTTGGQGTGAGTNMAK